MFSPLTLVLSPLGRRENSREQKGGKDFEVSMVVWVKSTDCQGEDYSQDGGSSRLA